MKSTSINALPLIDTVGTAVDGGWRNWAAGFAQSIQQDLANRNLRRDLARMDDALLRDIGVADDEIHRIRALENFTPRNWL